MNKEKQKKILISVTAGVLAAAVGVGAWFGIRHHGGEPVYVYEFMNVGMTEYWGDNQESYGPVSTDNIQTVFLSKTQEITEVLVKEGDAVKKGDVLMTFDTTLSAIDLERKRLEVEKLKLQLEDEKRELQKINSMKPMVLPEYEPEEELPPEVEIDLGRELKRDPGYEIWGNAEHNGSSPEKAMICWVRNDTYLTSDLIQEILARAAIWQTPVETDPADPTEEQSKPSAFVTFLTAAPEETSTETYPEDEAPQDFTEEPEEEPQVEPEDESQDEPQDENQDASQNSGSGDEENNLEQEVPEQQSQDEAEPPKEEILDWATVREDETPVWTALNEEIQLLTEQTVILERTVDGEAVPFTIIPHEDPQTEKLLTLSQGGRVPVIEILSQKNAEAETLWCRITLDPEQTEFGWVLKDQLQLDGEIPLLGGQNSLEENSGTVDGGTHQNMDSDSGTQSETDTESQEGQSPQVPQTPQTPHKPAPEPETDSTEETTAPTDHPDIFPNPLPPVAADNCFVVIKITEQNRLLGNPVIWHGLQLGKGSGFQFFPAVGIPDLHRLESMTPEEEGDEGFVEDMMPPMDFGSGLTAGQIAQLRDEQKQKIKDAEFKLKMAEADYAIKKREAEDGNIVAQFDGEVVSILEEQEARQRKKPFLKVSGGGGFYVEGTVSELDREKMEVGQMVTVNDWNSGEMYEGKVVSIGDFPVRDSGGGMGNPNSSQYPFKAFVDGSANLQAGSYVSIQYTAGSGENGVYLENPFLRTEKGESYVYVLGADGRLEKRNVVTGKSLWGNYTEIVRGLTAEDLVAFPYGKNVKPGAKAQQADISQLYR